MGTHPYNQTETKPVRECNAPIELRLGVTLSYLTNQCGGPCMSQIAEKCMYTISENESHKPIKNIQIRGTIMMWSTGAQANQT